MIHIYTVSSVLCVSAGGVRGVMVAGVLNQSTNDDQDECIISAIPTSDASGDSQMIHNAGGGHGLQRLQCPNTSHADGRVSYKWSMI